MSKKKRPRDISAEILWSAATCRRYGPSAERKAATCRRTPKSRSIGMSAKRYLRRLALPIAPSAPDPFDNGARCDA